MNNSPKNIVGWATCCPCGKLKITFLEVLVSLSIVALIVISFPKRIPWRINYASRLACGSNMKGLGIAVLVYANVNKGKYPEPDQWCDLLIKDPNVSETSFMCFTNENARSNYAINPNCEPNSPGDVVLLFETKAGWNQQGGPDLLTTENHKGKGSNILFNDYSVKFINKDQINTLKWKAEPETKRK
jgi:hypothetical protein